MTPGQIIYGRTVEENVITKAAGSINVTLFNTLSGITGFLINTYMIIACDKGEMNSCNNVLCRI